MMPWGPAGDSAFPDTASWRHVIDHAIDDAIDRVSDHVCAGAGTTA